MASPLVDTKLFVPHPRRAVVTRSRLNERLDRGAEAKLTLVSAPAGFGKTTAVVAWLDHAPENRSVAWLSLEDADKRTSLVLDLRGHRPACHRTRCRSQRPSAACRQRSHRSRLSWPRCSTSSRRCRTTSTWSSTTTTWSTGPGSLPEWRSCSSTSRRRCTW